MKPCKHAIKKDKCKEKIRDFCNGLVTNCEDFEKEKDDKKEEPKK